MIIGIITSVDVQINIPLFILSNLLGYFRTVIGGLLVIGETAPILLTQN